MKPLLLAFLSIVFWNSASAQYLGDMTEEVLNKLSQEERAIYWDCVRESKINKDSIQWMSASTSKNLGLDHEYYTTKVIRRTLKSDEIKCVVIPGKHKLEKPECMVAIRRISDDTEIRLIVYY